VAALEEAMVTQVAASAGLVALIAARFYPQMVPQKPTYPAVTYQVVSAPRESNMGVDPGIVNARVQFSAWGTTWKSARDVAEQLRLAFQRWRGTVAGTEIMDTLEWDWHDAPPELVNDLKVFQRVCECRISYRE